MVRTIFDLYRKKLPIRSGNRCQNVPHSFPYDTRPCLHAKVRRPVRHLGSADVARLHRRLDQGCLLDVQRHFRFCQITKDTTQDHGHMGVASLAPHHPPKGLTAPPDGKRCQQYPDTRRARRAAIECCHALLARRGRSRPSGALSATLFLAICEARPSRPLTHGRNRQTAPPRVASPVKRIKGLACRPDTGRLTSRPADQQDGRVQILLGTAQRRKVLQPPPQHPFLRGLRL